MNKKQKWLILISILIFLFVTLNPTLFRLKSRYYYDPVTLEPLTTTDDTDIFFTQRPMYQYWAVIAVPSVALFYYFKDENKKDKKPKDEQKQ